MTPAGLIEKYRLQPHPEGGWYREIHRSGRSVGTPSGYPGDRTALTVIYFLLVAGDFSAFHRVRSEEVWVHLAGAPLQLVVIENDEPQINLLSSAEEPGAPVAVVPPGEFQAARTLGQYTLVTCLVAPGFDFADFEMPSRENLLHLFPRHEALVNQFSRSPAIP